jgi:hypothetical protein
MTILEIDPPQGCLPTAWPHTGIADTTQLLSERAAISDQRFQAVRLPRKRRPWPAPWLLHPRPGCAAGYGTAQDRKLPHYGPRWCPAQQVAPGGLALTPAMSGLVHLGRLGPLVGGRRSPAAGTTMS